MSEDHRLGYPAIVILVEQGRKDAPMAQLCAIAADSVASEFADSVAVVVVDPGKPGLSQKVKWVPCHASENPADALLQIRAKLEEVGPYFAYTFVDASSRGKEFVDALVADLGRNPIEHLSNRLVVICKNCLGAGRPGWNTIRTVILRHKPELQHKPGMMAQIAGAMETIMNQVDRSVAPTSVAATDPYNAQPDAPQWCRLRADFDKMSHSEEGITPKSRARWARAITQRRVGLALGGSGAWGYAHVAIMGALREEGVPIDIIGGASSGSLFGAYYSVLEDNGLYLAMDRGWYITMLAYLAIISSALLEIGIGYDLGPVSLDDLEVVFLPIVTNLSRLDTEVLQRVPVPFGVRASGSAPGFFGPTILGDSVLVDAAVTDNVPAALVRQTGAQLLIASNPLPSSRGVDAPRTRIGRFIMGVSPFARLRSLNNSLTLLFHDVGDMTADPGDPNCVFYDPKPVKRPLVGTFDFYRAKQIVEYVLVEPEFQTAIRKAVTAWNMLRSPRRGRLEEKR